MEEERVKEEAAQRLVERISATYLVSPTGLLDIAREWVADILHIKGVRIESEDQGLPEPPNSTSYWITPSGWAMCARHLQDAGFVKCERREDGS